MAQAYADISAPIDSEDADVESDRGPVPHKPAEERTGKLLSVRLDDLHRAACRRPHKPERVVGAVGDTRVVAPVADSACKKDHAVEEHVVVTATAGDREPDRAVPTGIPKDDRPQRATEAR